jgi:hypothetical protein
MEWFGRDFIYKVGLVGEMKPPSSDARYHPTIKTVGFLARKSIIEDKECSSHLMRMIRSREELFDRKQVDILWKTQSYRQN